MALSPWDSTSVMRAKNSSSTCTAMLLATIFASNKIEVVAISLQQQDSLYAYTAQFFAFTSTNFAVFTLHLFLHL